MAWYRIDKGDGSRESVTEAMVRGVARMNYRDVELLLMAAKGDKITINSPFAYYEWEEVKGEKG